MRKRLLTLVLAGLLIFATACGSSESADGGSYETTTTASFNTKNAMGFEKDATAEYSTESNAKLVPDQAAEGDFELAEEQAVEGVPIKPNSPKCLAIALVDSPASCNLIFSVALPSL